MERIKLLVSFCIRYGLWPGLKLYFQVKTGRVDCIKLASVKHPFSLRANTSDIDVFYQVFYNGHYDIEFGNPSVIIDGGANVGLFAIFMKNKYPNAKIICIEPDSENFGILKKNTVMYDEIYSEQAGLWKYDSVLKTYNKPNAEKWGVVVEEDVENGDIKAMSMQSLFHKYDIEYVDVLKLDIESSEKELFEGDSHEWLGRVKTIVIELHDADKSGCSRSFFEAINAALPRYTFSMKGENVIIENLDYKLELQR